MRTIVVRWHRCRHGGTRQAKRMLLLLLMVDIAIAVLVVLLEFVLNESVYLRLQSIDHLHQLVDLDLLLSHHPLGVFLLVDEILEHCPPLLLVLCQRTLQLPRAHVLDLETRLEVDVQPLEFDEATGLGLDDARS